MITETKKLPFHDAQSWVYWLANLDNRPQKLVNKTRDILDGLAYMEAFTLIALVELCRDGNKCETKNVSKQASRPVHLSTLKILVSKGYCEDVEAKSKRGTFTHHSWSMTEAQVKRIDSVIEGLNNLVRLATIAANKS